ncbi:MAG TPA: allantoinase AllB, partial [Acidimicrobiales bacterium]|nr:allantoinase AllB [Acidimicrobiales bacterium]
MSTSGPPGEVGTSPRTAVMTWRELEVSRSTGLARKHLDLVIRAPRAIVASKGDVARAIGIRAGRIVALDALDAVLPADAELQLTSDVVVLPGIVDSHVHVCEPGNTAWEGFESATRAAVAGGITTLVDMPVDSEPPTISVAALEAKKGAAAGQCHVDVGFWGGAVPDNLGTLETLREAGVLGFKCFMVSAGPKFPPLDVEGVERALRALRGLDCPLLVHAEDNEVVTSSPPRHGKKYSDFLGSRPRGSENLAIAGVIEAARRSGGHVHICHLSSSDAVPMIESARREGVRVTAETCPHYLVINAEAIPDGATTFKCSPPIREASNRELLWAGLKGGTIDLVVSDHSPCAPAMKRRESGDFADAWGGISSIQFALPAVWTEARTRHCSLADLSRWMSAGPAALAGLANKGSIALGKDADLVVFAPDETLVVDDTPLQQRHPGTPYDGRRLFGVVKQTFLRGKKADMLSPRGELLSASLSLGEDAAGH